MSIELAARLVASQHPGLADRQLRPGGEGWDSYVFRLGDDLGVRFPRTATVAGHVPIELEFLPGVAKRLPLAVPAPVEGGEPDLGYPFMWSIVRWVPGRSIWEHTAAEAADLRRSTSCAEQLAEILTALAVPASDNAPFSPFGRGGPLQSRDTKTRDYLSLAAAELPEPATWSWTTVEQIWEAAPRIPVPPVRTWFHGDLHPGNVIADHGRLTGLIDWVDFAAGDPAVDLSAAWSLFDASRRSILRDACAFDDQTWRRAQGWAVTLAATYFTHSPPGSPLRNTAHDVFTAVCDEVS